MGDVVESGEMKIEFSNSLGFKILLPCGNAVYGNFAKSVEPDEAERIAAALAGHNAQAELSRLRTQRDEAVDLLELVLPMARGYADANRVGNNAEFVSSVDAFLTSLTEGQDQ